jgi:hypothetical protein
MKLKVFLSQKKDEGNCKSGKRTFLKGFSKGLLFDNNFELL